MATRPDTPPPEAHAAPAADASSDPSLGLSGWRARLYTIIFEADTRAGKHFDQALIAAILLSVGVVVLDSVDAIHQRHGAWLWVLEWLFTGLFTLEYALRLACVPRPLVYARSFFGLIDLLAIVPTYLALLAPGAHLLVDVRILRLLRIFRVLKLSTYIAEYNALGLALRNSRRKIMVFLSFVLMVVLILGTVMYVIEGPDNGFTSIPTAMYWAVTTMTTVGFGDITPKTDLGRLISAVMMMLGWGVLAVPTGIVTAEMTATRRSGAPVTTRTCPICLTEGHRPEAQYCWRCGTHLPHYAHD